MATQEQIFSLRIIINDPENIISFASYASEASFPVSNQSESIGYFAEDVEFYYKWNGSSYIKIEDFEFDDTILSIFIDEKENINYAACKAFTVLKSRAIKALTIKSDKTGQESTTFTLLKETVDVYSDLCNSYYNKYQDDIGNDSGKYISLCKPNISGGDY